MSNCKLQLTNGEVRGPLMRILLFQLVVWQTKLFMSLPLTPKKKKLANAIVRYSMRITEPTNQGPVTEFFLSKEESNFKSKIF